VFIHQTIVCVVGCGTDVGYERIVPGRIVSPVNLVTGEVRVNHHTDGGPAEGNILVAYRIWRHAACSKGRAELNTVAQGTDSFAIRAEAVDVDRPYFVVVGHILSNRTELAAVVLQLAAFAVRVADLLGPDAVAVHVVTDDVRLVVVVPVKEEVNAVIVIHLDVVRRNRGTGGRNQRIVDPDRV